MAQTEPAGTPTIDGRSARAARTRRAVVDALLALLHEGTLRPTARQIAQRAGVSLRSVYVHFDDLDDLFTAAAAANLERIRNLMVPVDATLPLPQRLSALAEQRSRIYEAVGAVRDAALLAAPSSPALGEILARGRRLEQRDTSRVFAAELDALPTARRRIVEAAVRTASSSATWHSLRTDLGLSIDAARAAVVETLTALLGKDH